MIKLKQGEEVIVTETKPCLAMLRKGQLVTIEEIEDEQSIIVKDRKGKIWWVNPDQIKKKPKKLKQKGG